MFTCPLHSWFSNESPCPACPTLTTASTELVEINSLTPISPYWDKIAEQLYPDAKFDNAMIFDENNPPDLETANAIRYFERAAFLKGASMQQLWVPVESGLLPTEEGGVLSQRVLTMFSNRSMETNNYSHVTKTWLRGNPTHWRYITLPGSSINPIVEQWGKMKKALGQIEHFSDSGDPYKAITSLKQIAAEALK